MAKRFKQFLLENEIRYHDNNSTIENIIEQLPPNNSSNIIVAKFVLYCAEDVFQFNNDETRNAARNCIDLIRKYINNPKSVSRQELNSTASNAVYDANNAIYAAWYAVASAYTAAYSVAFNASNDSNAAYNISYASNDSNVAYASYAAAAAAATATAIATAYAVNNNANIDEKIREEKLNEYKQYLNMLTARYHHSDENTSYKINQLTQNKPETEQQWFSFLTQIIDELEVKNIIRQLPDGSAELHLPFANISANSQLELIDIISRNERIRDLIYSWFV